MISIRSWYGSANLDELAYFELRGKLVHVTAIFIIRPAVLPYVGHFIFKGIPAFEVTYAGRCLSPMSSLCPFLHAVQGDGMLDGAVVVRQCARRKISERIKDGIISARMSDEFQSSSDRGSGGPQTYSSST